MSELQGIVEAIYKSHNPLGNINTHLFSADETSRLSITVNELCQSLSEDKKTRVEQEVFDCGPITSLLKRGHLFDIIIQGPHSIFYEDRSGLKKHDDCFLSDLSFKNFVELVLKESNLVVDQKQPFANGLWRGFRVHIVAPPISQQTTLTLRKKNTQNLKIEDLVKQGFLNHSTQQWVQQALSERKNFLVVGPTGSGKTTFLNGLLRDLPTNQRLIVVEDTDEIELDSNQGCKLLTRELPNEKLQPYLMEDLVKQALRMRPDRIVVGEVRGGEAKDLLQALATGHSGSLGTLHAHSAKQALLRLEMLVQMGAPQWSLHSVRQLILMSLDYLVVLKEDRLNKGIKEIYKLSSLEKFGILMEELQL